MSRSCPQSPAPTRGLAATPRRRLLGWALALPAAAGLAALRDGGASAGRRSKRGKGKHGKHGGVRWPNRPGAGGPCLPPSVNLQQEIDAAKPGGTLTLCAGTFTNQTAIFGKNLTLVGAGSARTVLSDGGSGPGYLSVAAGANVTVQGLTLTGWGEPRRRSVDNAGTLALLDVVVTKGQFGGIANSGALILSDGSVVSENASVIDPGAGIANAAGGTVRIDAGCRVVRNLGPADEAGGIETAVGRAVVLADSDIVSGNFEFNCGTEDNTGIANCNG